MKNKMEIWYFSKRLLAVGTFAVDDAVALIAFISFVSGAGAAANPDDKG